MEWWNLWVPFIGTLLSAIITIVASVKQNKHSEKFEKELLERSDMKSKKEEMRKCFGVYIHKVDDSISILNEFIKIRQELEFEQTNRNKLIEEGINPDHVLVIGNGEDYATLNNKLKELKSEWEKSLKAINQPMKELVLHFKPQEDTLDKVIVSIFNSLNGFNWFFTTNLPTNTFEGFIENSNINVDYETLEREMRILLND